LLRLRLKLRNKDSKKYKKCAAGHCHPHESGDPGATNIVLNKYRLILLKRVYNLYSLIKFHIYSDLLLDPRVKPEDDG